MMKIGTIIVVVWFLAILGAMITLMNILGRRMYRINWRTLLLEHRVSERTYAVVAGVMATIYVLLAWSFGGRSLVLNELMWITGGTSLGMWSFIICVIVGVAVFVFLMIAVACASATQREYLSEEASAEFVRREEQKADIQSPIEVYTFGEINEDGFAPRYLSEIWYNDDENPSQK